MIPVSEIGARLTRLMKDPPIRTAGIKAAQRAAARTNAQLSQARLPIRVNVQSDATKVRFTYAVSGPVPATYRGVKPADLLRQNLVAEMNTARDDALRETKRTLAR